jgi:nicotinamide-nucleotide amidase
VLTDRAGSSAYVLAGLVTYSNEAKQTVLGVSGDTLQHYGAVSEPVVRQMVAGAVRLAGSSVAVATSGVAGPGGGSEEKPVGTVWFAWGTGPDNTQAQCRQFEGDRDAVRRQAVLFALEQLNTFVKTL